jgi:transcriptional regulator with XRE-family HTH domain
MPKPTQVPKDPELLAYRQAVRIALVKREESMADLARKIGVSKLTLSWGLLGKRRGPVDMKTRIRRALGRHLEWNPRAQEAR